jgi:hypothetical protein
MSEISVIANSGIQFYSFKSKVDRNLARQNKFVYYEDVDLNRKRFWLDELVHLPELDLYATKLELKKKNLLNSQGKFKPLAETHGLHTYSEDQSQVYEVSNLNQTLKTFSNKWIPLPFFKNNSINDDLFGPTDWVRVFFTYTEEGQIEGVIAIDTTVCADERFTHSPYLNDNPNENKFQLCSNETLLMSFFDSLTDCQWVEDYLKKFIKYEEGESHTKHIASFIFLMRILHLTDKIPKIQLLSDKSGLIDVDLVLDIGNSKTCALLFENPNDVSFNLNKVKQLELIDLSNPLIRYNHSFSTRILFKDAEFGAVNSELNQNKKFQWPSPARVGNEAERIINNSRVELKLQVESKSYNSSPKRYLWDNEASELEWNFHEESADVPKGVFKAGISDQLKSDGSLCDDGVFGTRAAFSRRSLMTFVYLEIFTQAMRQINSIEFRGTHGNPANKRRLKRVIVSCPTAMIQEEQIALRQCAQDAMTLLNNYMEVISGSKMPMHILSSHVDIIPKIEDLSKNLLQMDGKGDWNYDEATVSQLMFMYGAIQHKFDGNPDLFFNLFGKQVKGEINAKREITLGSLDIGAGTSDLMICKYRYSYTDATELTPEPLYCESFSLAGDDLLKNLIQHIIIEGEIKKEEDRDCSGVILNHAKKLGQKDIALKLNGFFGKDNANMGYMARLMRISFINQIGIPLAQLYMSCANQNETDKNEETLNFDDVFKSNKPSIELLNYFAKHFEFRFEDLVWKMSAKKVNEIINITFSKLIDQIGKLMFAYSCDLIILSGRPCSFDALEKLFLKCHPVAPNRLINLNNYWVGKWYPFADNNGYIEDPKTVITVGSLIAMMGGKLYKLDKFRIDTSYLRKNLVSTADYLGNVKDYLIQQHFMAPNQEESTFMVYDLPFQIGFKQLNSVNYPARSIYSMQFSNKNIKEQLGHNLRIDSNLINDALEDRKTKLRSKLPYKVTISREFEKDKEKIKIIEINDNENNELSKFNFELKLQTLNQSTGYWLDSGEFNLSIGD